MKPQKCSVDYLGIKVTSQRVNFHFWVNCYFNTKSVLQHHIFTLTDAGLSVPCYNTGSQFFLPAFCITTQISGLMVRPVPTEQFPECFHVGKLKPHTRFFSRGICFHLLSRWRWRACLGRIETAVPESAVTSSRHSRDVSRGKHSASQMWNIHMDVWSITAIYLHISGVFFTTQRCQMWPLVSSSSAALAPGTRATVLVLRINGSLFRARGCLYGLSQLDPWLQATGLF